MLRVTGGEKSLEDYLCKENLIRISRRDLFWMFQYLSRLDLHEIYFLQQISVSNEITWISTVVKIPSYEWHENTSLRLSHKTSAAVRRRKRVSESNDMPAWPESVFNVIEILIKFFPLFSLHYMSRSRYLIFFTFFLCRNMCCVWCIVHVSITLTAQTRLRLSSLSVDETDESLICRKSSDDFHHLQKISIRWVIHPLSFQ